MIPYMNLTTGGNILAIQRCGTISVEEFLPERQADPDNQRPYEWISTVLAMRNLSFLQL